MISITRRFRRFVLAVGTALLILLLQHQAKSRVQEERPRSLHEPAFPAASKSDSERHQANALLRGGYTAAVYDRERFHEEVHGSVLWTLARFDDIVVKIYRPEWRFGFDGVIKSWWPTQPTPIAQFWDDLERDSSIRWIFFPTIDFTQQSFEEISPRLKAEWEKRKPEERFTLVGVRHWGAKDMGRELLWWAERNAISLLALGDHVTGAVRSGLEYSAGKHFEGSLEKQEALRRVRVETYIPVFPPDYEDLDVMGNPVHGGSTAEGLNRALVQCSHFDAGHRAMAPLFDELRDNIVGE